MTARRRGARSRRGRPPSARSPTKPTGPPGQRSRRDHRRDRTMSATAPRAPRGTAARLAHDPAVALPMREPDHPVDTTSNLGAPAPSARPVRQVADRGDRHPGHRRDLLPGAPVLGRDRGHEDDRRALRDERLLVRRRLRLFSNIQQVFTYDGGIFVRWIANSVLYSGSARSWPRTSPPRVATPWRSTSSAGASSCSARSSAACSCRDRDGAAAVSCCSRPWA